MPNFDKIAEFWDKYTYPWRPGYKMIDILKDYSLHQENTLILGSTHEFRKVFKERSVTICDLSCKMIEANDVGNQKEVHLLNDWFSLQGGEYDLIVGDLIMLMFDDSKKSRLLSILKKNLSKNGKILLRDVGVVYNGKNTIDINRLLAEYSKYKSKREFYNYISFELVNAYKINGVDIFDLLPFSMKKSYEALLGKYTPYNSGGNHAESHVDLKRRITEVGGRILHSSTFHHVEEVIYVIEK